MRSNGNKWFWILKKVREKGAVQKTRRRGQTQRRTIPYREHGERRGGPGNKPRITFFVQLNPCGRKKDHSQEIVGSWEKKKTFKLEQKHFKLAPKRREPVGETKRLAFASWEWASKGSSSKAPTKEQRRLADSKKKEILLEDHERKTPESNGRHRKPLLRKKKACHQGEPQESQ